MGGGGRGGGALTRKLPSPMYKWVSFVSTLITPVAYLFLLWTYRQWVTGRARSFTRSKHRKKERQKGRKVGENIISLPACVKKKRGSLITGYVLTVDERLWERKRIKKDDGKLWERNNEVGRERGGQKGRKGWKMWVLQVKKITNKQINKQT